MIVGLIFPAGQALTRHAHDWQRAMPAGAIDRLPKRAQQRRHRPRNQPTEPKREIDPGKHMHVHIELEGPENSSCISTGNLPPAELVRDLVDEAHVRYRSDNEGAVADYIPALARTPSHLFGLCVVGVQRRHSFGWRCGPRVFDPEHFKTLRLRASLSSDRRRAGAGAGRRERHGAAVQLRNGH